MPQVSLRHLIAKLTALALSTTAVGAATAEPVRGSTSSTDDEVLRADLAIDPGQLDPYDAASALGRGLALALSEMRPLSATHLAATWSLSADPIRRLAVAHALEWTFQLFGDAIVIDHLSHDADAAIRLAAARAAWVRRASGGDLGVLARLADDPDPEVRHVAEKARAG
jgi:hypothetical protein